MKREQTGNSYTTRQRTYILACLQENRMRHVTVKDIMDYLNQKGVPVGQTTVYRYLEKLARDGLVYKYHSAEQDSTCFQYAEQSGTCHSHYHLKCLRCGRLIHLECHLLDELAEHVAREHQFQIDHFQTIFYGCCQACGKKEADAK